jgi:hypothetical protein
MDQLYGIKSIAIVMSNVATIKSKSVLLNFLGFSFTTIMAYSQKNCMGVAEGDPRIIRGAGWWSSAPLPCSLKPNDILPSQNNRAKVMP